jgi:hypothetical protein
MNCDEAAELVSALCDGETVPRETAVHLGSCEVCRERLRDYVEMGAEMRCFASLETEAAKPQVWESRKKGLTATWWKKGWEAMRIPKFAFAALVVGIVGLGSGFAVEGARARAAESAVLLRLGFGAEQPTICVLSTVHPGNDPCSGFFARTIFKVRVLSKNGDQVNLGVRAQTLPPSVGEDFDVTTSMIEAVREQRYSFTPGKTLRVEVPGEDPLTITGEWMDHIPVMAWIDPGKLDPEANELRVISPLLLKNGQVAGDMEGGNAIGNKTGQAVFLYVPGEGSFAFSLSPMPGAIQGHVDVSRLIFEANGQHYSLVTGAPMTRAAEIWVQFNPNFRPPEQMGGNTFISVIDASEVGTAFQATK